MREAPFETNITQFDATNGYISDPRDEEIQLLNVKLAIAEDALREIDSSTNSWEFPSKRAAEALVRIQEQK